MKDPEKKSDRIDRLIAFFKQFKTETPKCESPDDSSWNQSEEEYQRQQAEWMKEVQKKKAMRKKCNDGA